MRKTKLFIIYITGFIFFITKIHAQENALHFDGVNDVVDCGTMASVFENVSTYTVESWLMFENLSSSNSVFGKRLSDSQRDFVLQGSGSTMRAMVSGGFGWPSGSLTTNTWYHFAVVYNGGGATNADRLKMYINGTLQTLTFSGTVPSTTPVATGSRFTIGQEYSGSTPISGTGGVCCGFAGKVEELRIWTTARTSAQISSNMNIEISYPQSGLAAYYRFNQGIAGGNNSGVTTLNDANSTYNGTLWNFALNGATSNWISGKSFSPFSVAPASLNFGNVPVNMTFQDSVTVANSGGSTITISSVTSTDGNFTVSPTSGTVNAGGTQKFYITFLSSTTGTKNGTITFNHNALGSPHTVSVSGTANNETFSASPSSLNFGVVNVGSSKLDSISVTNVGAGALTISNVTSNNSEFTVTPTSAGGIMFNQFQKFYITFTPTTFGNKTGIFTFTHNGSGSPSTISVSGASAGAAGFAVQCDGTNDKIASILNSSSIFGANYASTKTIEVWCKPMGTAPVVSSANQGSLIFGDDYYWGIYRANISGQDKIWVYNNSSSEQRIAVDYTVGQWIHIAFVHSGGILYAYKNGTFVSSLASGNSNSYYFSAGYGYYAGFNGIIDEARAWSVGLSGATIAQFFNKEVTASHPDYSALKLYWKFNEGTGTTTADASGNGRTGTLQNGPTWVVSDFPLYMPTFTIAASTGANGSISPSGNVVVDSASNKTFTITPNANYHIDSVIVNGVYAGTMSSYTFTNVLSNQTIVAKFAPNALTISASAGENGSITPSGNIAVSYGANQSFTISANAGYHIDSVTVDGTNVGAVSSYDFTNVIVNHTITAVFAINTYTLTVNAVNGTIVKNPEQANYNHETQVILTAIPNIGYHFVEWSGDLISTENPDTITMSGNKTVTANFVINTYTLSVLAENGMVIKNPEQENYEHGMQVILTAIADTGYHFVNWSGDFNSIENPDTITMDANKTVTANFAINTYTLTASVNANHGVINKNPDLPLYEHGMQVEITAIPETGYHFSGWSGDASGAQNPLVVMMDKNKIINAVFIINQYTITLSVEGGGTVTKIPERQYYSHGTQVKLTATPFQGYYFSEWGEDAAGTQNPLTITIDTSKNILAVFEIYTYSIEASAGENGSIEPEGEVEVNYGENQEFIFIPEEGYHIDSVFVD